MNGPSEQLSLKKTKYQCDECDSMYLNQYSLKIHKKAKHEGIDTLVTSASLLLLHLMASENTKNRSMKVLDTLVTSVSLDFRTHKESKHDGIRYPCDQCEYAATTSSSLRRHKESKYRGIRYS